jgi:hypothetical protein
MVPFETALSYALYFFALNYAVMFGAFYLHNDWALRFLFRYPLRPVLADNPSADSLRWSSIGIVFHRMEASFGLGLAVLVGAMTWACAGNVRQLGTLSAGVAAHAVFVSLNHTLNYAGKAEFCRVDQLPPEMRTTVGVLRVMGGFLAVVYGALAVVALSRG